jgi:hypothetical protein
MGSTRALRQNTTQPVKRSKRFEMQNAVTTFAGSRFVDREAVVVALRECTERLKRCQAEVVAVYLFGSFATGSATPRSDIDGAVGVSGAEKALRQAVRQAAFYFSGRSCARRCFHPPIRTIGAEDACRPRRGRRGGAGRYAVGVSE